MRNNESSSHDQQNRGLKTITLHSDLPCIARLSQLKVANSRALYQSLPAPSARDMCEITIGEISRLVKISLAFLLFFSSAFYCRSPSAEFITQTYGAEAVSV
jgi:hypothetical protein